MISRGSGNPNDQPLYDRCGEAAFCRRLTRASSFARSATRCLYLSNPPGLSAAAAQTHARRPGQARRDQSPRIRRPRDPDPDRPVRDGLSDAGVGSRADGFIRRARARSSTCTVPTRARPERIAANCLLARRLAERGVRFIQLFHRGWDQHTHLPTQIAGQCRDTDQPSAALVADLQAARPAGRYARRLGRRVRPDRLLPGPADRQDYGRDHHPRCFTIWMAGGGIKPGITYGATDDIRLQHHRAPGARPRPARHDSALPGD